MRTSYQRLIISSCYSLLPWKLDSINLQPPLNRFVHSQTAGQRTSYHIGLRAQKSMIFGTVPNCTIRPPLNRTRVEPRWFGFKFLSKLWTNQNHVELDGLVWFQAESDSLARFLFFFKVVGMRGEGLRHLSSFQLVSMVKMQRKYGTIKN